MKNLYQVQLSCPSILMVEGEDPQDAVTKFWEALNKSGATVYQAIAGSGDAGPALMERLQKMNEPEKSDIVIAPASSHEDMKRIQENSKRG